MTDELKPCPFCGSTNVLMWTAADHEAIVECQGCKPQAGVTLEAATIDEAARLWNTRTQDGNPYDYKGALAESLEARADLAAIAKELAEALDNITTATLEEEPDRYFWLQQAARAALSRHRNHGKSDGKAA